MEIANASAAIYGANMLAVGMTATSANAGLSMPIHADLRHFYRTPEWFAARAAVRERAGDRCERCGAKNGAIVIRHGFWRGSPVSGSVPNTYIELAAQDLALARLQGLSPTLIQCGCCHRNNVAGDDRPENLAWWCRGCHLRHDKPHHRDTRAARKDRGRGVLDPEAWGRQFEAEGCQ
jgi:hypothetical protein